MLTETIEFLQEKKQQDKTFTYEIIIVDDGSRDQTVQVAFDFAKEHKEKDVDIRILALEKNRGKGGAVTQVIQS